MREVFVDTSFFIAILNPKDRLRSRAERVARSLGNVRLVTTDGVLFEVLNYFAEWGSMQRRAAAQAVRRARASTSTTVIPQTRDGFDRALDRYAVRLDKGYSLTDCDSMLVMEDRSIHEALTSDQHFVQGGFQALLADESSFAGPG
jgi:predicted nucleic acid-binding protein